MPDQPSVALQVSDLSLCQTFLTEKLGFTLAEHRPDEDVAYIIDSDGDALLLAGPAAQNLASYLAERHLVLKPGESLDFRGSDPEALQTELHGKGATDTQITRNRLGDRILCVRLPDDYVFRFLTPATLSFERQLDIYARSLAELDEALAGLSESDMALALYPGSWSIRQIVHHIADADILFGELMKVALSSSGTKIERPTAVGNDRISTEPEYQDRPVDTSIALYRAFHAHILDIVKYVPDAAQRYVEHPDGYKRTFEQLVHLINRHSGEHLDEILEIRRKHGL